MTSVANAKGQSRTEGERQRRIDVPSDILKDREDDAVDIGHCEDESTAR